VASLTELASAENEQTEECDATV